MMSATRCRFFIEVKEKFLINLAPRWVLIVIKVTPAKA
jgi:hypothetical protein